ncbi:hypothetical protein IQ255_24365 [Pleurocapsales cyanobacterium LEGE 10410]|nr:hypothetical protein [Pleurocapsales cyanobacterium LEGE 10410]
MTSKAKYMMLKLVNLRNIATTSILSITIGAIVMQPAASNANSTPVKIDSLDTTRVNATSSIGIVCQGSECESQNYGTGTNIKLNGFTVGDKDYSILKLVDEARFKRVNNDNISGTRHIYFLEQGEDDSIGSSAIFTMEDAVRSDFINGGTDNVFANSGGANLNNIERVDFVINSGLVVKEEYVDDAGFLLLERGGNDPFKIAAIKGIDANGNPTQFGNLINIPKSTWGNSGIGIKTHIFQNQSNWNAPRQTASIGNQKINGIFVSIASLGIDSGETVYGYALFPNDISSNNDLINLSDFPGDTSAASGEGGLDLISSGGLFIPDDVTEDAVFEPALAVNDAITTDEDTSVNGNVLTNDTGDSLTVTSTGLQTLSSGALVTINSNGSFTYDPNGKFESLDDDDSKNDSFTYTIQQDGNNNTSSATVTVTVTGITDTFAD